MQLHFPAAGNAQIAAEGHSVAASFGIAIAADSFRLNYGIDGKHGDSKIPPPRRLPPTYFEAQQLQATPHQRMEDSLVAALVDEKNGRLREVRFWRADALFALG